MNLKEFYNKADYKYNNGMLYQGDCLDIMKDIPDSSINLILTDPPYTNIINEKWDKNNVFNEYLMKELLYIWCGIGEKSKSLIQFMLELDKYFYFKDLITWKKKKGIGMRKGWLYTREECLWYVKNNKDFIWCKENQYSNEERKTSNKNKCIPKSNYKRLTNVWCDIPESTVGNLKNKIKLHPCEKPVLLMERIIKVATSTEEDLVLDCFMGSGTTGVACINTNRKFIGIEKEEKYFDIAKNRIEETFNK